MLILFLLILLFGVFIDQRASIKVEYVYPLPY